MELVDKTKTFAKEVSVEVKKVSWPSRQELQESTVLVILSVFLIMVFIGLVDRIFAFLVELILG